MAQENEAEEAVLDQGRQLEGPPTDGRERGQVREDAVWGLPGSLSSLRNRDVTFDPDLMLPASILPWILDEAERLGVPPVQVAVGAIVALSSVVGVKVGIRPRKLDEWTLLPILWGAVVAPSGHL